MNREEPHLSYSQISSYMQCSLKYRSSYIDRLEPEFTPSALHYGPLSIPSCRHSSRVHWKPILFGRINS
jgi:hypothetical protein